LLSLSTPAPCKDRSKPCRCVPVHLLERPAAFHPDLAKRPDDDEVELVLRDEFRELVPVQLLAKRHRAPRLSQHLKASLEGGPSHEARSNQTVSQSK
jgi:hypothetical protein